MSKTALIILDGWGYGDKSKSDAIYKAKTPFFDGLLKNYANAQLRTDGEHVGLPKGQMGNSEVGHMNIGAGRIVYQELTRIDKAIKEGEFRKNKVLVEAINHALVKGVDLHLMGLVSDGGVHSSQDHLHAILELCAEKGISNRVYVHGFTDGRDCNPTTGKKHFEKLSEVLKRTGGKLSSVIGRYYAMDRDQRWGRVKLAYDLMHHGKGEFFSNPKEIFDTSYKNDITDEFIKPARLLAGEEGLIKSGDAVICFNFRTDRCREICDVLTQHDFPEFDMKRLDLAMYTMTEYDSTFKNVNVIYKKDNLHNTIGAVLEEYNLTQVRIAETEKYPHVSYFFSGGNETPFKGEKRIMVPSPKVATYDLKPEMSAHLLADEIIKEVKEFEPDFICLNFANTDMVGHTGVYDAIVKAAEEVDKALNKVMETLNSHEYDSIVIADHGNADFAINPDGSPNTAHSLNPVPIILVSRSGKKVKNGILADVAPTILQLLNIQQPSEMSGQSLIV